MLCLKHGVKQIPKKCTVKDCDKFAKRRGVCISHRSWRTEDYNKGAIQGGASIPRTTCSIVDVNIRLLVEGYVENTEGSKYTRSAVLKVAINLQRDEEYYAFRTGRWATTNGAAALRGTISLHKMEMSIILMKRRYINLTAAHSERR